MRGLYHLARAAGFTRWLRELARELAIVGLAAAPGLLLVAADRYPAEIAAAWAGGAVWLTYRACREA
jgi:hypothetical protein